MTTVEPQLRAGCYLRISSDPDDKRSGVDRQRQDATALCDVMNWTPVRFYVDNDRSASNGKQRPEWERLLSDIESGEIDAIAAWDQDRGWRMMHELEDLRKFFQSLGRKIRLATTGQGEIDLYSPAGVLTAQIKTAVSEHKIAMMRVRQRRAAVQKAESGKPKWKRAFGYLPDTRNKKDDDDGTRQIDPQAKKLVRKAYAALLAGVSLGEIAKMLNKDGAYGLNGKPWTASTMSLFLRSPRNAGLRAHRGQIVGRGTWPELVDEKTWRAAQAYLNAPGRAPGRRTVRQHLLTGVLKCGATGCDGHLNGYKTTQGVFNYRCRFCFGVAIRSDYVVPYVYSLISTRLAKPDAADLLKAEIHDAAKAEALRTETNTLQARLNEIADERADGLLDGPQAKRATDRIKEKLAILERQRQDQERLRVFDGLPLGKPEVADAIQRLSPDRLRSVIDVLCTITVLPVGKGTHVFNPNRIHAEPKH